MHIYKIYVIQLSPEANEILVNYALGSAQDKITDFKRKHPQYPYAKLRSDLYELTDAEKELIEKSFKEGA